MKLKTVIIGGSNTVMLPGYLPTLLSTMAKRGVELDVVADLAVGERPARLAFISSSSLNSSKSASCC